jgi:hypothetical protein
MQALLPAKEVNGIRYLEPDMSLLGSTPAHKANTVAAGVFALLYPVGIPLACFFVLRKKRHLIYSHATPTDKHRHAAFSGGPDGNLYRKGFRTTGVPSMDIKLTKGVVVDDMSYTLSAFDEETDEFVFASCPYNEKSGKTTDEDMQTELRAKNLESQEVVLCQMSYGWLCSAYDPHFW